MYRKPIYSKSLINLPSSLEGETIELKITRLLENKEPIDDGAPTIYTARKDGVDPAYNIRTDRFEIAAEIMDKLNRDKIAKSEGTPDKPEAKSEETPDKPDPEAKVVKKYFGKPESTADTANK